MRLFDISNERLVEFYETQPGRETSDKIMAQCFYNALKAADAQADYLTQLINAWMTAYNADERAKKAIERMVFRSACECCSTYIGRIVSQCNVHQFIDTLYVFRTLNETWEHFKGETQ